MNRGLQKKKQKRIQKAAISLFQQQGYQKRLCLKLRMKRV